MTLASPSPTALKFSESLFDTLAPQVHGLSLKAVQEATLMVLAQKFKLQELTAPPNGVMQEWSVDAIYEDNDQQWGDSITARTALEAAVLATMYIRMDCGNVIKVVSVENADGEMAFDPSMVEILADSNHLHDFSLLCNSLSKASLTPLENQAFDWLSAEVTAAELRNVNKSKGSSSDCWEDLSDYALLDTLVEDDVEKVENTYQSPCEAILALCDAFERSHGGVLALEQNASLEAQVNALYCIRALVECFGPVVDDYFDFEPIVAE